MSTPTDSPQPSPTTGEFFPEEPPTAWDKASLNKLLIWGAKEKKMSDVKAIINDPLWMRIAGKWQNVSKRRLVEQEVNILLEWMYRAANAIARINGGESLDFEHDVEVSRLEKLRFRCNASGVVNGRKGVSITMRVIPAVPPDISEMGVEDGLMEGLFPQNGLVLMTGVMGSGKSTLLASVLRRIIQTQPRSVASFEAPIEFDLTAVPNRVGPVEQSQIPTQLRTFVEAVRSSTRRAHDVVLVGEARDSDTLGNMIELAELGPAVYSTVHTRGVSETPGRIVQAFPHEEHSVIISSLMDTLRCVVQQRLIPKVGGGRVAIREYLVFTQDMRDQLVRLEAGALKQKIDEYVFAHGQPLLVDAKRKLEQGLIEEREYQKIAAERARSMDSQGGDQ